MSALLAQLDSLGEETGRHDLLSFHTVTGPVANGFEIAYTQDSDLSGKEVSLFFLGSVSQARQLCTEFTDSSRTAISIEDRLPFDPDISRYEITVGRNNFLAARYTKINYNKTRKIAFRKSLGYRLTYCQFETSSKPFFPVGFISFDACGEGDRLFSGSSKKDRFSETELNRSSTDENTLVHTFEMGLGLSYRTSPLRRFMFTLELNAFALLPLNTARLKIESPEGRISTNYMLETKQQLAVNFDLSAGLVWRLR